MTKPMRIDGVDISHYQSGINIDWTKAKNAGVKFVYHKATEGLVNVDASYTPRRAQAKANGVLFGAYHFAQPRPGNAPEQAEFFLRNADPQPGDMVPMLDLEVNEHGMSEDQLTTWVHTFFTEVFKYTGSAKGLLYTHYNMTKRPEGVLLWVARYNNDNRKPVVPKPFWTWAIWQFSNGHLGTPHTVPGFGHVDINTLHKWYPWARLSNLIIPAERTYHPIHVPAPEASVSVTVAPVDVSPAPPPVPKTESDVARLLRIATAQVGYHEGRSGGHWNNKQKFSPAVKGLEWSQNQPWCATFVSWCVTQAGLTEFFPITASTDAGAKWFKDRNEWSEYPAVGAQVFYGKNGNMDHTGLVYKYDDTYVYTIEGNTNLNGSAEGDGVYKKKRVRRSDYVQGYGYPNLSVNLKTADPDYYRSAR